MVKEIQHAISRIPPVYLAVLIAACGGIIYQVKAIPSKAFTFISRKLRSKYIFTVTIYQYDDLYDLVEQYFAKHYNKQYTDVQAFLHNNNVPDPHERKRSLSVIYKQAPNLFTINYDGKKLFVSKQAKELNHAQSYSSLMGYNYSISGFKAKDAITSLLKSIVDDHCKSIGMDAIRIYSNDSYGNWCNHGISNTRPLDGIVMEDTLKSDLIKDIDSFNDSEEWYMRTGIPYKRTYLFHGPPGTGKTSLAKSMSRYVNKDIYYINLSILRDDGHLQGLFKDLPANVILLIEDIDAAFTDRKDKNNGITFSGLINCLDGVFCKHGLITCITTNHIDRLDSALIRPGRVDKIMKIGYPTVDQIDRYMSIFYESDISLYLIENHSMPMSEVQEICIANKGCSLSARKEIIARLENNIHNSLKKAI